MQKNPSGEPLITIVTPARNAAVDLSATIASIVGQRFTNKEFIVVDGGSTDGTVELLQQRADVIDRWISEPDDGVYDALNKGIDLATGEWLYFLGAGDVLADENVLERVAEYCGPSLFLYGDVIWGDTGRRYDGRFTKLKLCRQNICQQAIFYHRSLFEKLGKFDTRYRIGADWAFNLRCFADRRVRPTYLNIVVAKFRGGGLSSYMQDDFLRDREQLIRALGWPYWALYRMKRWRSANKTRW